MGRNEMGVVEVGVWLRKVGWNTTITGGGKYPVDTVYPCMTEWWREQCFEMP